MAGYRVISADNHVYETPTLWGDRVEPKFKDRCPHLVSVENGQIWMVDGKRTSSLSQGIQPGRRFDAPETMVSIDVWENVLPGAYIPDEAVKDMDLDGVDAAIIYPTVGLSLYYSVADSELFDALCSAYNDSVAEFCSAHPKRLKGIAMLNVDDVGVAVREMERCARQGFVGAMITVWPERLRYDSPEYEPLWAAAQDLELPISLHFDTNRPGPDGAFGVDVAEFMKPISQISVDRFPRTSIADMIFSGVFERYPRLRVGSVEMELGWAPHFVERMDYWATQNIAGRNLYCVKENMLPGDYFRRNIFLSFEEDAVGMRLRDIIGVDNILWGADYPHAESTFPYSRRVLAKMLADCTEEEEAKIAGGNAARLYKI